MKGNRNEIADKSSRGVADQFVPDGGKERKYAPLDWRTWRYLELAVTTADEPLVLENLKTEYTAYPFTRVASFESDDPELDRIWQTGWDTLRICSHDAYMDTPYWERLQYLGDTRIEALVTYVTTGDDRLPRGSDRCVSRFPALRWHYLEPVSHQGVPEYPWFFPLLHRHGA